jgi:hypothetical protein
VKLAATIYRGDMGKTFTDLADPFPKHDARPPVMPTVAPLIERAGLATPAATIHALHIQKP